MKHITIILNFLKTNKLAPILIVLAIIGIILSSLVLRPKSLQVVSILPANLSPNISPNAPIVVTFSQPLPANQIVYFELKPPIAGTVTYAQNRTQATFLPQGNYQFNTTYTVTIRNPSLTTFTSTFTTRPQSGFSTIIPQNTQNPSSSPRLNFTNSLPYYSDIFSIEYLETSNTLIVTINALPYEDNKQKALNYITSQGIQNPFTQFNISIDLDRHLNPPPQ